MVWWAGYEATVKLDIKSFHPKVKAPKLVKRFQRYSHFKIIHFYPKFLCPQPIGQRCIAACRCLCSHLLQSFRTTLRTIGPLLGWIVNGKTDLGILALVINIPYQKLKLGSYCPRSYPRWEKSCQCECFPDAPYLGKKTPQTSYHRKGGQDTQSISVSFWQCSWTLLHEEDSSIVLTCLTPIGRDPRGGYSPRKCTTPLGRHSRTPTLISTHFEPKPIPSLVQES